MVNPKMTPVAKLGDLVTIVGYANRLFRVDSYTHEFTFERGVEMEEIYYDCSCVTAGEYTLGAQEDLTVLCNEAQSEEFLKTYAHPEVDVKALDIFAELFGNMEWEEGGPDMTKPIKETKKTPTKQQQIDALLDSMIDVYAAQGIVDDPEGYYEERLAEIESELTSLTGGR